MNGLINFLFPTNDLKYGGQMVSRLDSASKIPVKRKPAIFPTLFMTWYTLRIILFSLTGHFWPTCAITANKVEMSIQWLFQLPLPVGTLFDKHSGSHLLHTSKNEQIFRTFLGAFSTVNSSEHFITNRHSVLMPSSFQQRKCTLLIQLCGTRQIFRVALRRMKEMTSE